MRRLPTRVMIALGITVIAVLVLAGMAVFGGTGGSGVDRNANAKPEVTSTSTTVTATTTAVSITTTSLQIPVDWYPKGSSRYSDRKPPVTVTTIAAPDTPASNNRGSGG